MYRTWPYYGLWASSIAKILFESRVLLQSDFDAQLGPAESTKEIKFSVGQKVQVKPEGTKSRWRKPHCRVPGYIYGCQGVIERVCGVFKDPEQLAFDVNAQAEQPLYRVRFPLAEIWPEYKSGSTDTIDVEIYQHWFVFAICPSDANIVEELTKANVCITNRLQEPGANPTPAPPAARAEAAHSHDHSHGDHSHDHDHDHAHDSSHSHSADHGHTHEARVDVEQTAVDREGEATVPQRFAEALIAACIEKGVTTKDQLRQIVEKIDMAGAQGEGPRIVAKAWTDPEFKARLLKDASSAVAELGLSASNTTAHTVLTCVEDTPKVHNVIVCTLCSCYPRSILGIPPDWYKSRSYRTRVVRDPRGTLADWFDLKIPDDVEVRVHDSTADLRYIVLPLRPAGTEGWSEEKLAKLVTRDAMVGCAAVKDPATVQ